MSRLWLSALIVWFGCSDVQIAKQEIDLDEDGYVVEIDCDDSRKTVHPDAPELCDGLDNDCDDLVDEDAEEALTFYADTDGDGYGDPGAVQRACAQPEGFVVDATDCDDAAAGVHPGAQEVCDGVDQDCDGQIDEDASDVLTFYADADGDGWGDAGSPVTGCTAPEGAVDNSGDCDDADNDIHPGAPETDCTDPVDYDCDGITVYADDDGDSSAACEDCDDNDADVRPDAQEICNARDTDEDCDGLADNDDPSAAGTATFHLDSDGDRYGDPAQTLNLCDATAGYVADGTDCDDSDAAVHPGAQEVCDALDTDEDCDGPADDNDPSVSGQGTYYLDSDLDGFGDISVQTCDPAYNEITTGGDCDDADPDASPLGTEICGDGTDQDCDGTDEACSGGACDGVTGIDTLNYNGMTYYMLALEPCLPYYAGNCCSGTTDSQEADAFCRLAGCNSAVTYTVELKLSTNCYCWGNCTGSNWTSNCCSGSDTRYFITEVVCR